MVVSVLGPEAMRNKELFRIIVERPWISVFPLRLQFSFLILFFWKHWKNYTNLLPLTPFSGMVTLDKKSAKIKT